MAGFLYRDFGAGRAGQDPGAGDAGQDNDGLARLRADQMRRALREASGLSAPQAPRAVSPPPMSGQILDADDPGGDSARVIFADGYADIVEPLQNPARPQQKSHAFRRR